MGNLLTHELKRDFVHLSDHSDFKNALRATGELLETYAKAEQLRLERKQQRMREREQNRSRGQGRQRGRLQQEADPRLMGGIHPEYERQVPERRRRRPQMAEERFRDQEDSSQFSPSREEQDPLAEGGPWQSSPPVQPHDLRRGPPGNPPPSGSPMQRFEQFHPEPGYGGPSMLRPRRQRQPPGMPYVHPDIESASGSPSIGGPDMRMPPGRPRRPNAQRRRSGRSWERRPGMESTPGGVASPGAASGSRRGRGSALNSPRSEIGEPQYPD